jgi:hypothetical protein
MRAPYCSGEIVSQIDYQRNYLPACGKVKREGRLPARPVI